MKHMLGRSFPPPPPAITSSFKAKAKPTSPSPHSLPSSPPGYYPLSSISVSSSDGVRCRRCRDRRRRRRRLQPGTLKKWHKLWDVGQLNILWQCIYTYYLWLEQHHHHHDHRLILFLFLNIYMPMISETEIA